MRDSTMAARRTTKPAESTRIEMRWLPVTDERGATRMEATWIEASAPSAAAAHHAA